MRAMAHLLVGMLLPLAVAAHHSVAGFFDPVESVEIEGVVTATLWRNPHTEFQVDVTDPSGRVTSWRVETGALGVLRARGLAREFLRVGDRVRVFGDASLREQPETFARNLRLSNGKEVMLTVGSSPYFSLEEDATLLEALYDSDLEQAARRNADGLFRVWSTDIEEIPTSGSRMFDFDYPLSREAEAKRSQWDASDDALLGCTEWTMPSLMGNPLPVEFLRQGDDILLRFEEDDNERLVHMDSESAPVPDVYTLLGYSTGRWDGATLIVETTKIAAARLGDGTPHSSATHLIERFTPSSGGNRLDFSLRIEDPDTFTEPFELERYWVWRPEIEVGSYACNEEQQLR